MNDDDDDNDDEEPTFLLKKDGMIIFFFSFNPTGRQEIYINLYIYRFYNKFRDKKGGILISVLMFIVTVHAAELGNLMIAFLRQLKKKKKNLSD
ncbi:hypothetical protein C1645_777694, partial [Glomus cerebriforme]